MFVPPQGFRHACALLLTNRIRTIALAESSERTTSPNQTADRLTRLAEELAALAEDMKVSPQAAEWLTQEYDLAVDRFCAPLGAVFLSSSPSPSPSSSRSSDDSVEGTIGRAKTYAKDLFAQIGRNRNDVAGRDLFLIHVPHDRLSLAAPLAIELTKRRFTVAFSEYEVEAAGDLRASLNRGLDHHRAGALLWTPALLQKGFPAAEMDEVVTAAEVDASRVSIVHIPVNVDRVASWLRGTDRK